MERTVSLPEIVHRRIFVWKMLMRAMPSVSIAKGLTAGRCVSGMSPWLATNMNQFHMYVILVRTRKYVSKTDIYTVQGVDVEVLAKVLANPEMAALLTLLAISMEKKA